MTHLEHIVYYGRPALQLSNAHLTITVVPEFSARIMSLQVNGQNYLWSNEALLRGEIGGDPTFGNWMNWGGYKTWLAPQASWPDPLAPSTEMDHAEWEVVESSDSAIELISPIISWAGVRLGRRLSLATDVPVAQVRESITNVSREPHTWSVWAVAQFPIPGWATYPPGNHRLSLVPPAQVFEGDRLRFASDNKWKMGAYVLEGWGAYQADSWGRAFQATFGAHPQSGYPNRVNLETWSNTNPDYMELEWLGPSVTLEPGQKWDWDTEWRLK